MEELKIGIDIGNRTVKCVGKNGFEWIYKDFQSCAAENSIDSNLVVYIPEDNASQKISLGTGMPLVTNDKTRRKYMAHTILAAIYKVYGHEVRKIKVGVGLPVLNYKQVGILKDFKSSMCKMQNIKGTVCNKPMNVDITIDVYAEAYSAFYALYNTFPTNKRIIIVDHGYRTTDYICATWINGSWHIENYDTINIGLYEIYSDISKNFLNDSHEKYEPHYIDHLLLNEPNIIVNNKHYNLTDYVQKSKGIIENIYEEINIKQQDLLSRQLHLVSGGANLVYPLINHSNKVILSDSKKLRFANAVGYYMQL